MQPPPDRSPAAALIERGAAALRAKDRPAARALLAAALRADPGAARAWLWLSGALDAPAEQRYCLERAAGLDPGLAAARRGLEMLAAVAPARPALLDQAATPSAAAPLAGARQAPLPPTPAQAASAQLPRPPSPPARPGPTPPGVEPRQDTPLAQRLAGAAQPAVQRPPTQPPTADRPPPPTQPPAARRPAYINPWLWIWARPQAALRSAIMGRSLAETALLGGLLGISAAFAWAAWRGLGAEMTPVALGLLVLLAGPPLGWGALVIAGVLLRTAGRWLGGRGGAGSLRSALAWSGMPLLAGLLLWALQLALLPAASFAHAPATPAQAALALLAAAIHLALALWAAGLSVVGVAEAHQIGALRAALAWLLAALILAGGAALVLGGAALIIGLRGG